MTWLAPGGGVDKNVFHTINGLKDEFEFHLAVGSDIFHNEFERIEGLPIHIIQDLKRNLKPWKDLKSTWAFYKLIKKEKYDIVHTHETKASLFSRIAAWFAGCPNIIYGLHGVTFNDPLSKARRLIYIAIEKLTVWMCDHIVSVSQDAVDIYHQNGIAKKISYDIVYSGIDTRKFSEGKPSDEELTKLKESLGFSSDDLVIINVGRFSFAKAQRYTIEAFAKIKEQLPNCKLLFVGDGELREDCEKQVADLGLSDSVHFYGFTEDLIPLLYCADISMLTSLREGLPRVVVEAGLCSKPTVAFQVEGIREVLLEEFHDFIVPQEDVDSLIEVTLKLLKDHDLRIDYGAKEQAFTKGQWDYSNMNNSLRRIYNDG